MAAAYGINVRSFSLSRSLHKLRTMRTISEYTLHSLFVQHAHCVYRIFVWLRTLLL